MVFSYSQEEYDKILDFLLGYAHEDWLGFSVISPRVTKLIGRESIFEQRVPMLMKVVSDLLGAGASIGDFAATPGNPFTPWLATKEESLARIERETRALGKMPMSGDVGWIFFAKNQAVT